MRLTGDRFLELLKLPNPYFNIFISKISILCKLTVHSTYHEPSTIIIVNVQIKTPLTNTFKHRYYVIK